MPPTTRLRIPVIMHHKVGAPVRTNADRFLNVSARDFQRQARLLARLGYRGITFAQAVDGLFAGRPLPPRPVCITFDDGCACVGEHAAPVLAALGWPATVFVPTAHAGRENAWDRETGRPLLPLMGWERLRELAEAGWEIAGHTRTHPHLDLLDDSEALAEMAGGRADIAAQLGVAPSTLCYPFGGLNDRTPGLARQAGFAGACTTRSGLASPACDPFLLPRVKVARRDGLLGLLYRLWIRPRLP